jgi:hypothetical protein
MNVVDLSELSKCLATLQWWAVGAVVAIFVVGRFFTWKDKQEERLHKTSRAKTYADALESLGNALKSHEETETQRARRLEESVLDVRIHVRKCEAAVLDIARRTKGRLSCIPSIRIIQLHYELLTANFQWAIEQQLWENDPESPDSFLSRRIRTLCATAMTKVRDSVRAIKCLSVSGDAFFPAYQEQSSSERTGGERFVLVDYVWQQVAPFFAARPNGNDAVDAMRLVVENTVTDYFSGLVESYRMQHPEDFSVARSEKTAEDSSGVYSSLST